MGRVGEVGGAGIEAAVGIMGHPSVEEARIAPILMARVHTTMTEEDTLLGEAARISSPDSLTSSLSKAMEGTARVAGHHQLMADKTIMVLLTVELRPLEVVRIIMNHHMDKKSTGAVEAMEAMEVMEVIVKRPSMATRLVTMGREAALITTLQEEEGEADGNILGEQGDLLHIVVLYNIVT